MGETVVRISLGDIQVIRVKCKHPDCGYVCEMPPQRLAVTMAHHRTCPACNEPWWETVPGGTAAVDPFQQMQQAIRRITAQEFIEVEFVVSKSAVE